MPQRGYCAQQLGPPMLFWAIQTPLPAHGKAKHFVQLLQTDESEAEVVLLACCHFHTPSTSQLLFTRFLKAMTACCLMPMSTLSSAATRRRLTTCPGTASCCMGVHMNERKLSKHRFKVLEQEHVEGMVRAEIDRLSCRRA